MGAAGENEITVNIICNFRVIYLLNIFQSFYNYVFSRMINVVKMKMWN